MFKTLKEFFSKKQKTVSPEILVIFDGDQVSVKLYKKFYERKTDAIKHIWAHGRDITPKGLPLDKLEVKTAYRFGKESTDKLVGIIIAKECAKNSSIKEVHVVSGDGDTIDTCATLALEFGHVKFTSVHINTRVKKRGINEFLKRVPTNCNFVSISA